jgi:ATP-dependent Clp protease ATP-binding subunit ClpA
MFERFTAPARAAVHHSQREAHDLGHAFIGTEHLLLALLSDPDATVARLLRESGIDAAYTRAEIKRLVGESAEPDLSFIDADSEDAAALKAIGIDLDAVRAAIEESFGAGALHLPRPAPQRRGFFGRFGGSSSRLPFSKRAKKVLELSLREALRLGHNFIAPEHIMLGLLREGEGLAAKVIADKGTDFARLRDGLTRALPSKASQPR